MTFSRAAAIPTTTSPCRGDVPAGASSAPGAILHDVADSAGDILGAVTGNAASDGWDMELAPHRAAKHP